MNKETAARLLKYRKASSYSQEELAEKIGVSRQAISKWERGESSPDTDNLIALARPYGITIDELINGTENVQQTQITEEKDENQEEKSSGESFKNGIHVHNGKDNVDINFTGIHIENEKGESVHIGKGCGIQVNGIDESDIFKRSPSLVHAILPLCSIIAYLIIGFSFEKGWAVGWIILFASPIIELFIKAVKTKNPSAFAYPLLTISAYILVGMLCHIWHPTWIVFLTIPLYYIIANMFKTKKTIE